MRVYIVIGKRGHAAMSKPSDLLRGTLDLLLLKNTGAGAKAWLGRRHLEQEAANWKRLSGATSSVMRLKEA
jgi:hypothetical protein